MDTVRGTDREKGIKNKNHRGEEEEETLARERR